MLTRHPAAVLLASVLAAAAVAAGVTYVLTSRQSEKRAGSPMPMVTGMRLADAETVIRAATGASRIDVERGSGVMPAGRVVAQTPAPGGLVSRSAQVRLVVSVGASEPA
jgi:beta-lactam-binding protein with PASTA domain